MILVSLSGDEREDLHLIEASTELLDREGELLVYTRFGREGVDLSAFGGCLVGEVTDEMTPEDFRSRPGFRAWKARVSGAR
jgi:hypothetical protein